MFIHDLLEYSYLSNALIAAILSAITCAIIGSYIVSRRMVFMAGGITHASFGGLGIAFYIGTNPILGALFFAIGSSIWVEWISNRTKIREDSAVGIIWSLGMAIGALFMSLRPGYTSGDMSAYLFGSIISVTHTDVVLLCALTAFIILGAVVYLRPIVYAAFDRDFAKSQGVNTKLIGYIMAVVVATTIVLSIRIMGIVLLISLLTMPAVAANMITKSFTRIIWIAPAIAILGNVIGLILSYNLDTPSGATIIFTLSIILFSVKLLTLQTKSKIA